MMHGKLVSLNIITLLFALSTACNSKKNFGGDVPAAAATTPKNKDAEPQPPSSTSPTPAPTPGTTPPSNPKCDEGQVGLTKVVLLSTGILTKSLSQTLRYQLSVLSCKDGSIIPIKDQAVFFDLNAVVSEGFKNIEYAVLDENTEQKIVEGDLQVVEGSDLFGNTGRYAHWKTEDLSYSTAVETLILEIKLDGNTFSPPKEGASTIDSYLKVGTSQAVTQPLEILD